MEAPSEKDMNNLKEVLKYGMKDKIKIIQMAYRLDNTAFRTYYTGRKIYRRLNG